MAETATRSPAAPADAEETFELSAEDLAAPTEGTEDEVDLEGEDAPEAETKAPQPADDKKPEPKAEAKPEAEPEPEPKPAPKVKAQEPEREEPVRLDPIAREERAKRKKYAALYAEKMEALEEAERTIQLLRAEADQANDPALKKHHEEILAKANSATDLAELAKILMGEMDRRDRARVRAINPIIYQSACDAAEAKARAKYKDFEKVIAEAGLYDAIQIDAKGQWKDQRIGQRIFYNADGSLNADPADRMYKLALGKLEYEREKRGEPEPDEVEEKPVKNQNGNGAGAVKKDELVEAERRGAARVVEEVSKTPSRLRGIRNLPKAGSGPAKLTRADLDTMLEREPERYQRLILRQPALERWHLGG